MRKLLSVLLVAAMVLGLVGTAFAATDVTGTKYDAAVTRLNALSILKGYEDGTFKPNNNITRAEFAAVAVRALGLEEAAKNTFGATKFADVPASHWAAGYINVAVGRGIIKGYPDGTFKPEANVTNAEAMAMLIRVLGYEPAVTGEWPMNYVSKAAEIGLTAGLSLATDQPATRGDVALMTDKALTIDLMVQSTYGTLSGYTINKGHNLLSDKLAVTELKGKMVTATPLYDRVGLKANEVMLGTDKFTFDSSINMNALIGHTVDAWAKDGNIFYVIDKTPASKIVTFKVKSATATTLVYEGPDSTTAADDVTYTVNGSEIVYFNHVQSDMTSQVANLPGSTVTLILDSNNKVAFVDALKWNGGHYVVTKVDTGTAPYIRRVDTSGTQTDLQLKDVTYTIVDATGAVKTLADVAKNDILSVASAGAPAQYWLRIVRNSVTGDVTKTTTTDDTDLSAYKVYIGDTAYGLATGAQTRVTNASGTTYTAITTGNVDNLVGKKVTALLDASGKIFIADTSSAPAVTNIAFVDTAVWTVTSVDGDTNYVKLLKLDGTKVALPIDLGVALSDPSYDPVKTVGNLISYTTTDGVIDGVSVVTPDAGGAATINASYDRITIGSNTYVVTADTKIYSQIGALPLKPTAITWTVVEGGSGLSANVVANADFPARADIIVITAGMLQAQSSTAVMLKSYYTVSSSGSLVKHMIVDENGTEKDYAIASGVDTSTFLPGDLATVTFNSSNKVATITELVPVQASAHEIVAGELDSIAGVLMIGGNTYFSTSKTVVYDYSGASPVKVDWSAVQVGCSILFYADASNNLTYVVITAK